jgi:hypothetical protein
MIAVLLERRRRGEGIVVWDGDCCCGLDVVLVNGIYKLQLCVDVNGG